MWPSDLNRVSRNLKSLRGNRMLVSFLRNTAHTEARIKGFPYEFTSIQAAESLALMEIRGVLPTQTLYNTS